MGSCLHSSAQGRSHPCLPHLPGSGLSSAAGGSNLWGANPREPPRSCGWAPPLCPWDCCSRERCLLDTTYTLRQQPLPVPSVLAAAASRGTSAPKHLLSSGKHPSPLPALSITPQVPATAWPLPKEMLHRSRVTHPATARSQIPGQDPPRLWCPICFAVRGAEGSAAETPPCHRAQAGS